MNPYRLDAHLAHLAALRDRKAPDTVVYPTISLTVDGAPYVAVPEDVHHRLVGEHAASAAHAAQVACLEAEVAEWRACSQHNFYNHRNTEAARERLEAERDGNAEIVRAQAKRISDLDGLLAETRAKLRSQADRHAESRDRYAAEIANLKAQLAHIGRLADNRNPGL